ncbi:Ig-like domain-containing protein [bacterium]|nr:Ig-like domain-containing protein [bacterium]
MKHVLKLVFILIIILTGCTEEDPLDVINDQPLNSVEIISAELEIKAYEGTVAELPFVALVKDASGASAYGVEIEYSLIVGTDVTTFKTTSDGRGLVRRSFLVEVKHGKESAQLVATVAGDTDVKTVSIIGLEIPTRIQLSANTPTVTVIDDENVEISITATATNDQGVGLPDISMHFALYPSSPTGEIFGTISQPAFTDHTGSTTARFNSLGKIGSVILRCTVDGLENDTTLIEDIALNIIPIASEISELNLFVNPGFLLLSLDTIGTASVSIRVEDQDNNGIPNLRVDIACQFGTIANATLTDSTGHATAEYNILPIWDFPTDEDGEIVDQIQDFIRAAIPNSAFEEYARIEVQTRADDTGSLSLTSDVEYIYADNGRTFAHVQAVFKDANNQAMANREIIFTSTHGSINSPVITDSMGVARAIFSDVGLPSIDEHGDIVPAVITAIYNPWSISASIEITIRQQTYVTNFSFQATEDQLTAGSGDSTKIGLVCFTENGGFPPDSTEVLFDCDLGHVEPNPLYLHHGSGEFYFYPGYTVGTAHLRPYIVYSDTIIYGPLMEFRVNAGPPKRISVTADPQRLNTDRPTEFSTITATIRDTMNNHVSEGYLVTFAATLGSLDRVSASTDQNGQASVQLRPGVESGVSVITATVNTEFGEITGQTTVDIESGVGYSIELRALPENIGVSGTGVNSQTYLTASLFDSNHNYVQTAEWIIFEILYEPSVVDGGCHFRNGSNQNDSAQTSNGRATVIINAGSIPGLKTFKASAYFNNRQDTVSAICSKVYVTSGPPHFISVSVNNEGVNAEGGCWNIEVSARISDRFMNPVADSIPVVFSCDSVAQIGAGFTGNENRHGQSTRGVAIGQLTYQSENTFNEITIVAEINSPSGIKTGERRITLPLQRGVLTLDVSPGNWMIDRDPDAIFTCQAELRDGHGIQINNAPVIFNASRGIFYWFDYRPGRTRYVMYDYLEQPPEPAIKYTGWNLPDHPEHREEPGQATTYLMGEEEDFFFDLATPEINLQVNARVVGYDDVMADPVIITVTRHP